jgi:hypothetical protein
MTRRAIPEKSTEPPLVVTGMGLDQGTPARKLMRMNSLLCAHRIT